MNENHIGECTFVVLATAGKFVGKFIPRNKALFSNGDVFRDDDVVFHIDDVQGEDPSGAPTVACEGQFVFCSPNGNSLEAGKWISSNLAFWYEVGGFWVSKFDLRYQNVYVWSSTREAVLRVVDTHELEFIERMYFVRAECTYCDTCAKWYHASFGRHVCPTPTAPIQRYHWHSENHDFAAPTGWGIGFEVEKSSIGREDRYEVQPLFVGWERDTSCGVEGITNIYSLSDLAQFRKDVRASAYCNAETTQDCGGHVNLSAPGLTIEKVRRYCGLIMALYRHRLTNTYAREDKKLHGSTQGPRRCAIRVKTRVTSEEERGMIEFRLVAKVESGEQLIWRFRFFQLLAKAIDGDWSFKRYVNENSRLLLKAYETKERVEQIKDLAYQFDRYVNEGIILPDISRFI